MSDPGEIKIVGEARIIYKHNKPYGIRDNTGFLFFFADVFKFENQEERYREEIEQQFRLADYLLKLLNRMAVVEGMKGEKT